ncbi:MAG: hypothetical protein KDB79_12825 [Acidobacteria bacterium]|nr:hypothetical protein [Acidobacteriota bacterium]
MSDENLIIDEEKRMRDYEQVKSYVGSEVKNEIAANAATLDGAEAARSREISEDLQHKAVDEIAQTSREVDRGRFVARISQIVDYAFFLIYGLLMIRLLLELFAARESAGFVQFIKSSTNFLYKPFAGIVPSPAVEGGFTLALPIVLAIVVYALLHLAINGLLRIFAHRKTVV